MSKHLSQHFSPRASLCALGPKIQSLKLLETLSKYVFIKQKIIKHTPVEKLYDAFIAILAGAHGLCEINTRLRADPALQRAFGRTACAEQSVVQETLNACNEILHQYGHATWHNYRRQWQLLDFDLTGLPCGKKAERSHKGYFPDSGIRYGRQLGRVVATPYREIIVDQLYSGNRVLTHALRPLIIATEQVLDLNDYKRSRTILRVDAGGGSLKDVNWMLDRGYQLHGKDRSLVRAANWATTVEQWYDDPQHADRQMGWAEPLTTVDYARPVRRLIIRWRKDNGHRA